MQGAACHDGCFGVVAAVRVYIYCIYSQLQIRWHSILRLFLKTFNLVPGVPGFSWDSSFITWY